MVLVDDANLLPAPVVKGGLAYLWIKGETDSMFRGEYEDRPQWRRIALGTKRSDVVAHG